MRHCGAERLLEQVRREGQALLRNVLFREDLVSDVAHAGRV
jgi:hypothetical protein